SRRIQRERSRNKLSIFSRACASRVSRNAIQTAALPDVGLRDFGNTDVTILPEIGLDICKIVVIIFVDERRHSFRPSKAARLRVGARVVAIKSDRFSTG